MLKYVKFVDLAVTDQDRAVAFYTENLGLRVAQDMPYYEGDWRWLELEIPGASTRILLTKAGETVASDEPGLLLVTDDVTALSSDLKQKGVEFIQEPKQAEWNPNERFAIFRDSEGNLIMISDSD